MDAAQLSRCDTNWNASLVVISMISVIAAITILLRIWTNLVFWRMAKAGRGPFAVQQLDARPFTLTEYLLFVGYVSPHLSMND